MTLQRAFLSFWIGGIVAFIVVLFLHGPLAITAVPDGILAHQSAGSGARVDAIHAAWRAAGVYDTALVAMIGDLAFVAIFSLGSLLGGLYFRSLSDAGLKALGTLLLLSAVIFGATDFTETIAQLQQLVAQRGMNAQASIAAMMFWPKVISWTACFVLPIIGLWLARQQRKRHHKPYRKLD